jgi:hypothetical protein
MRVCLVCIAKNEENYIEEWISYHKKLGFDKIFVYENNWRCSSNDESIVKIPFDGEVKQTLSYNHFLSTYHNEFDWVAFFDVDEFLVLKKHNNVKDFLINYKDYRSVGINWVLFGDNGIESVIDNDYSVLKRFTKRQIGVNQHVKSIVNLNNPPQMGVHVPKCQWVDTNKNVISGPFNQHGSDDIAQINHYFCKTREEFKEKISRGRSDASIFRTMNEFDPHNTNMIEDLTALKFYNS